MHLKYRLPLTLLAALAITVCRTHAQEDDEDEEEFGGFGFYAKSNQAIKIDLKLTQSAQVTFGQLGNVPSSNATGYADGYVNKDDFRTYNASNPAAAELDINGHQIYTTGTRYKTYSTPNNENSSVVTDYLGYRPGFTRYWQYVNSSQANANGHTGYIAFNNYSAQTQGQSLAGSRGYTGGIELSLSRLITNPAKRFTVSIVAGLSVSGINSSTSGTVLSNLHTVTDYYLYHPYVGTAAPTLPNNSDGTVANPIYTGPTVDTTTVPGLSTETTTTLTDTPGIIGVPDDEEDGAEVKGNWKIKGAYFTLKVGPQVMAMLTRNIGLSASVGLAGSYVGTSYTATESFTVDGIATPISNGTESSTKDLLLAGYYANIDATWALNERTGMFAGFSYESLGDYNQSIGGRTAKIDLGGTAGVRGGLSIKF